MVGLSKPKVMICGDIVWAHEEVQTMLAPLAELVYMDSQSRKEFYNEMNGKYVGVAAIYHHAFSEEKIGKFDKDLIDHLPETCKWIAHGGAGYDQIDTDACKERGIGVSNTPGAVDHATATTALYLLISTCRQFSAAERHARQGKWKKDLKPAHDPSAMTLGILGLGGTGLTFANLAHAFPMKKILYYSRSKVTDAPEWVEYCHSMDELLGRVDILSVHVPLKASTRDLIGAREFGLMKKGAILINTARGPIVNEDALVKALKSGQLSAYGTDVHATEPVVNAELREMPNCTLLPHVGTHTMESQKSMEVRAWENIRTYLMGGKPQDVVPELR